MLKVLGQEKVFRVVKQRFVAIQCFSLILENFNHLKLKTVKNLRELTGGNKQ